MLWNFIIMNIFVGLIASAFEAIRDDKNTIRTDSASKCLVCRCGLGRGWPTLGQARNERFCLTWVGWDGGGRSATSPGRGTLSLSRPYRLMALLMQSPTPMSLFTRLGFRVLVTLYAACAAT